MAEKSLFIPAIGTSLLLAESWTFSLFNEYRNQTLTDALGYNSLNDEALLASDVLDQNVEIAPWSQDEYGHYLQKQIRLPAGSVLKIDRIYIRKGAEHYNSITFHLIYCPIASLCPKTGYERMGGALSRIPLVRGRAKGIRFWAKLHDVNNLIFDDSFRGDFRRHNVG